jgi:hypothetical protein
LSRESFSEGGDPRAAIRLAAATAADEEEVEADMMKSENGGRGQPV